MTDEPKRCPFCGSFLTVFGKDVRGGKVVDTVIHGMDDSDIPCPLSLLVFRVDLWNTRPIEDELRAEIKRLNGELLTRDAIWLPEKDAENERLNIQVEFLIDAGKKLLEIIEDHGTKIMLAHAKEIMGARQIISLDGDTCKG